jgi:DNA-binding CsgD family transcriptional regulator
MGKPMTSGYQALTSKEKETLHLLVNGYDAKSMARHLGLSVHTVNERLRDARRKMAVSSSREAARLMREAEGKNPESIVPTFLGDAANCGPVRSVANPQRRRGTSSVGWVIGGIVMLVSLAMFALSPLPWAAQVPSTTSVAAPVAESAAVQSARHWLELGDASDWKASYDATGTSFQSVNTLALWESTSQSVRVPLGRVISRQLIDDIDAPTPPNGNHVVRFRARFANKPEAIETVALTREDGQWRVVGVYLE